MTPPTILSLPVPAAAVQPGVGKDSGPGGAPGSGSGQGTAQEFASMVSDLVAALLGATFPAPGLPTADPGTTSHSAAGPATASLPATDPATASLPATDPATASLPATDPATSGRSATAPRTGQVPEASVSEASAGHAGADLHPAMPAALAALPHLGPASDRSAGLDEPTTRPMTGAPDPDSGPVAGAPVAAPVASHSGGVRGVSQPADAPDPQPESGSAPLGAAPATAPTAPTAAEAPAPTPAPTSAATAAQLVTPIVSVHRRGPDGSHTITVDITPDELGPVRVEVELRDGSVELRLAGHSEAARDALRAALPDLRRALEAAGVGTGTFQIAPDAGQPGTQNSNGFAQFGQPQHGGHPQNGHARPDRAGPDGRAPHQPEAEPAGPARSAGSLDLQL